MENSPGGRTLFSPSRFEAWPLRLTSTAQQNSSGIGFAQKTPSLSLCKRQTFLFPSCLGCVTTHLFTIPLSAALEGVRRYEPHSARSRSRVPGVGDILVRIIISSRAHPRQGRGRSGLPRSATQLDHRPPIVCNASFSTRLRSSPLQSQPKGTWDNHWARQIACSSVDYGSGP